MSEGKSLLFLLKINSQNFSKEEAFLLEAKLFVRLYQELIEIFREEHSEYFHTLKFTSKMEKYMLESNFIRLIIRDILSTENYTLDGIAYYTHIHEDIITEFASGLNIEPSANSLLKILELHISVREELYNSIMKKLALEFLNSI